MIQPDRMESPIAALVPINPGFGETLFVYKFGLFIFRPGSYGLQVLQKPDYLHFTLKAFLILETLVALGCPRFEHHADVDFVRWRWLASSRQPSPSSE